MTSALTFNSDNNYVTAALTAGYALGKITDVFLEANHYRADNYTDNPEVTLPFNAGQTTQSAFLTWVRRQNERLIYLEIWLRHESRRHVWRAERFQRAHRLRESAVQVLIRQRWWRRDRGSGFEKGLEVQMCPFESPTNGPR